MTFEQAYDEICTELRRRNLLPEDFPSGSVYVTRARADVDYDATSDYLNACWFPYGPGASNLGLEQKEGELILYASRTPPHSEEIVYHLSDFRWPQCEGERTYRVEEAVAEALRVLQSKGEP